MRSDNDEPGSSDSELGFDDSDLEGADLGFLGNSESGPSEDSEGDDSSGSDSSEFCESANDSDNNTSRDGSGDLFF